MPLDPAWVSHCIDRAKHAHSIVINEYTLFPEYCSFEAPDLYFGSSSASGLGWGAAAALGAKLARPEAQVLAVIGDGAYMFSNPAAVHHASALHDLPVLFVVMNNAMWGAVERSTLAMYPDGFAAKSNDPCFVGLEKLPAFEKICEAAGGYGERVEEPGGPPPALQRGLSRAAEWPGRAVLERVLGAGGAAERGDGAEDGPPLGAKFALVQAAGAGADRAIGLGRNSKRAPVWVAHADHCIVVGRRGARLEGFQDHPLIARSCAHAALGINADELDAGRHAERYSRFVGKRDLHEITHDRGRQHTAGSATAEVARLVVAEIDADHEIG